MSRSLSRSIVLVAAASVGLAYAQQMPLPGYDGCIQAYDNRLAQALGKLEGTWGQSVRLEPEQEHVLRERATWAKQVYDTNCGFCHGADARGTSRTPSLVKALTETDRPRLLASVVFGSGGMPSFAYTLSPNEAALALNHSLIATAGAPLSRFEPKEIACTLGRRPVIQNVA
jgi:mono/diheme cytochrome c family protein